MRSTERRTSNKLSAMSAAPWAWPLLTAAVIVTAGGCGGSSDDNERRCPEGAYPAYVVSKEDPVQGAVTFDPWIAWCVRVSETGECLETAITSVPSPERLEGGGTFDPSVQLCVRTNEMGECLETGMTSTEPLVSVEAEGAEADSPEERVNALLNIAGQTPGEALTAMLCNESLPGQYTAMVDEEGSYRCANGVRPQPLAIPPRGETFCLPAASVEPRVMSPGDE